MEKSVEELKFKISELEKKVSELSVKNEELLNKNYLIDTHGRKLESENDRLLRIIENLSKGYAENNS